MKNRDQEYVMKPLVPLQVRIRPEARTKLKKIAAMNGLSANDAASLCIAAGLNIVGVKLEEIHNPPVREKQPA